MPRMIAAEFETRRDAEMSVEHLVQEHGLDRKAITIVAASDANSAGTKVAGSDTEGGREKVTTGGEPVLAGTLRVSLSVDNPEAVEKVLSTFATYNGKFVQTA